MYIYLISSFHLTPETENLTINSSSAWPWIAFLTSVGFPVCKEKVLMLSKLTNYRKCPYGNNL